MPSVARKPWELPQDVLAHLMPFLPGKRVAQAACVCQSWNKVIKGKDEIWMKICAAEFGASQCKPSDMTWKQLYQCEWKWRNEKLSCERIKGYAVECIQLTSNGLIAGSVGGPVIINPSDGSCQKLYQQREADMFVVTCFKAVGQWIVGASSLSKEIRVWDAQKGICTTTLKGVSSSVLCVDFVGSPPETIITGYNDGTIGVWNVKKRVCTKLMRGHVYMVSCVNLSGKYVLSGSCDRTVKVWPLQYGHCMETWESHDGAITCLDRNGNTVVTGSYDGTARIWDLASGTCVKVLNHPDEVLRLKVKGNWIVTACGDKFIRFFNATSGRCFRMIKGPSIALSLDFDGYCVVCGFKNNTVCLWSIDPIASNFAPPSKPIQGSAEVFLKRMRSIPSAIPRCPTKVLHSAATDLPDEESDIFKDTQSESSDEFYEGFELDVAIAVDNVFKESCDMDLDGGLGSSGASLNQRSGPAVLQNIPNEEPKNVEKKLKTLPSCRTVVVSAAAATKLPTCCTKSDALVKTVPKPEDRPRRFARITPDKRTVDPKDNVIEPCINPSFVSSEKPGEVSSEKLQEPASGPQTESAEAQRKDGTSKRRRSSPGSSSIVKIFMHTLPCLLLGGVWLAFRKNSK